ncbi:MAG: hypothetical protein AAF211_16020 [Myxococcota bacterium]
MKVCPICGDRYKDYIDFCFNDGAILTASAAAFDEAGVGIFSNEAVEATESVSGVVDPGLVDIDNVIDEEPTQRTDTVDLEADDDLTVPRLPNDGSPDDGFTDPERTSPTESDTDPAMTPASPAPTVLSETTDPSLLDAPIDFEDEEPADDEDTPVLQEPVLAVTPPSGEPSDYENANTVVPADSLATDPAPLDDMSDEEVDRLLDPEDDDEPAPIGGGGPTLAPTPPPPPIPHSLGPTLPLHEVRPTPMNLAPPSGMAAEDAKGGVETRPISPRPSATPTLPAIQLRPGGGVEEPEPEATGTGIFVIGLGAFVVGVAFVALLVVMSVALGWLGSSDEGGERRAALPERGPSDPLPPPEFELPEDVDEDPDEEIEVADGVGVLPPNPDGLQGSDARESSSISVVSSLSSATDGTGTRPVLFESEPSNAQVALEGQEPFRTPYEIRLNIGETYSYTMTYPGYDPVKNDFSVMAGSGLLRREERLERTPTAVSPRREGPIMLGPTGCRLRVDGQLMRAEDIVGGTKIDKSTGRPALFLPFQLKGLVLGEPGSTHTFQVVLGVGTPPECAEYGQNSIEYTGQASIFLAK